MAAERVVRITVLAPFHWGSRDLADNFVRTTWSPVENRVGLGIVGSVSVGTGR